MTWCDLKGICCNVCFRNPLNAILRATGGGVAPALRISRKMGVFLGPPHVHDFVKERSFLYPGKKYKG